MYGIEGSKIVIENLVWNTKICHASERTVTEWDDTSIWLTSLL